MYGSFNSYASRERSFSPFGTAVWLGKPLPLPVGGVLAEAYSVPGILIPAGSPVNLAGKVLTPIVPMAVTAVGEGTVTIKGGAGLVPAAGLYASVIGEDGTPGTPAAITAVTKNSDGTYEVTAAVTATEGGSVAITTTADALPEPTGYLYNDIYIPSDAADGAKASGSVIVSHAEGLLISRTPAASMAKAMKTAVPNVVQVEE